MQDTNSDHSSSETQKACDTFTETSLWTPKVRGYTTSWIENGQEGVTAREVDYVVVERCQVVGNEHPEMVIPESLVLPGQPQHHTFRTTNL